MKRPDPGMVLIVATLAAMVLTGSLAVGEPRLTLAVVTACMVITAYIGWQARA